MTNMIKRIDDDDSLLHLVKQLTVRVDDPGYLYIWEKKGGAGFSYLGDAIVTKTLPPNAVAAALKVLHRVSRQAYQAGRPDLLEIAISELDNEDIVIRSQAALIVVAEASLSERNTKFQLSNASRAPH